MIKRLLATRELGVVAVLALEILVFALLLARPGEANPFLRSQVMLNAVEESAVLGLAAIGSCLVIISGGIDLAVGSTIALVTVVVALLHGPRQWPAPAAAAAGLAVGAAGGSLAALIISRAKLPPFIVTLGLMSVLRGLAYLVTGGRTITVGQSALVDGIGDGAVHLGPLQVPVLAVILVLVAVLFTLLMSRTVLGRQIVAVGGNEEAARLSAVRVTRVKVAVYSLAGLTSALAGCAYLADHGAGQSTAAVGWELDAIAAAVLGGASLSGGRGSVPGACLGALIFRILLKGLTMLGASRYQQVIVGVVVIVAVVLDQVATARARRVGS